MRFPGFVWAAGALVAISALARASRADTAHHPRVALSVDPCLHADPAEVRRITSLELDAELADEGERDTTQVRAACRDPLVLVEVRDPITGKSLSRTVNLVSALVAARSRLLALAIVELVSASWTELESNPEPAVAPASALPSDDARAAALRVVQARNAVVVGRDGPRSFPERQQSAAAALALVSPGTTTVTVESSKPTRVPEPWGVEGLVQGRAFLSPGVASFGFGAALLHHGRGPVAGRVDVVADHGDKSTPLGSVAIDSVSAAPSVSFEKRWAVLAVDAGAGFRLGGAVLTGHPNTQASGSSLVSAWGGPFVSLGARARVAQRLAFDLGAELGDAPFPVIGRVVGANDVALTGIWLGVRAGAAVLF